MASAGSAGAGGTAIARRWWAAGEWDAGGGAAALTDWTPVREREAAFSCSARSACARGCSSARTPSPLALNRTTTLPAGAS